LGRLIGPYHVLSGPLETAEGKEYEARDPQSGQTVSVVVGGVGTEQADAETGPDAANTAGEAAGDADPRLGQILADTYRLVERIGVGGMGIVYRAWDVRLRRRVALKLLTEASLLDSKTRQRFESEARVLARLGHPSVVRVYDVGRARGVPFFAMELLPGPSLAEWIAQRTPDEETWRAALDVAPEALEPRVRWIRDAARAAEEAHQAGIVHRDLKPGNLMLDERETIRVLDFGLAHVSGEEKTRTQARLGTPRFMAPEQINDPKTVTGLADVYSLGLTLHALLCLQKPFSECEDEHQILTRAAQGHQTPLRRIAPRVPADLETIVSKALEVLPQDRYTSAAAFADDLDCWLHGRPITARPAGLVERARKYVKREPVPTLTVLVLVLSVVLLATINRTAKANARARAGQLAMHHIQAVEKNDPTGIALFAHRLEQLGMQEDAIRYLTRAAEADHVDAMYNLGRLLLKGKKQVRNLEAAEVWLRRAAIRGHPEARALLETIDR
jgi:serine/threonine protein kinase